jgi:rare lipoprotein A
MRAGLVATAALMLASFAGSASADRPTRHVEGVPTRALAGWTETGWASWYGPGLVGNRTSSGVRFDTMAPMAAHKSLAFGSVVLVTSLTNGRSTWVVIRDRGPFITGRIIDLSLYSARQLGMEQAGIAPVRIEVLR